MQPELNQKTTTIYPLPKQVGECQHCQESLDSAGICPNCGRFDGKLTESWLENHGQKIIESMDRQKNVLKVFDSFDEIIVIDASWLHYRSWYAFKQCVETREENGEIREIRTGGLHGFLWAVANFALLKPTAAIILALDSKNLDRKKLYPEYKAGRKHEPEIFEFVPQLYEMASVYKRVCFAISEGYEADDVIYTIACTFSGIKPVLIFARDNDIYQALEFPGVSMSEHFEPICDDTGELVEPREYDLKIFGVEKCQEKYKCLPHQLGLWKAFRGDSGDNVKGYHRLPTALIDWIIDHGYSEPDDFFESIAKFSTLPKKTWGKWLDKILADKGKLYKNFELVKLREIPVTLWQNQGSWANFDEFQLWQILKLFNEICGNPWVLGACKACGKNGRLKTVSEENLCIDCYLGELE